jgi:uroporphyrinogen-III synthase
MAHEQRATGLTQAQPLAGRHVVITRPRGQADDLARRLKALGARVTALPAIAIEPVADAEALDVAVRDLGAYDWIVLTSANGVRALAERLKALGLSWATRRRARIAVIGPATADVLREHGVLPDVMPQNYIAEAIVEELGNVAGQRILLLRADIARRDLADELCLRGADVDEVAAYRSVPLIMDEGALRTLLGPERPDAITFTSSSTVRGLMQSLREQGYDTRNALQGIALAAIGPITAATLQEYGLEPAIVAAKYTTVGLADGLAAHFQPATTHDVPDEGDR